MTEYWVSQKRFWCKYCKCWMADTKPARSHHDNGVRHKTSVQQFFKDNRQKQKEERETKIELEREMRSDKHTHLWLARRIIILIFIVKSQVRPCCDCSFRSTGISKRQHANNSSTMLRLGQVWHEQMSFRPSRHPCSLIFTNM